MKLLIDNEEEYDLPLPLLKRVAAMAQQVEGISLPCCVQLMLTDDPGIRLINARQRGVDRATDVLSFPAISFPGNLTASQSERFILREWDVDLSACYLGDIVISMDHARMQADEYGHSLERELCYLLVHGLFHLFGYDHTNEEDKAAMREREEKALEKSGISQADSLIIEKARQAMKTAYVPYSHYQVGACLMCDDGRTFTGCNVENASYGLTNCAERTAVFKAISEGAGNFTAIAIAANAMPPWPCGACRQVLSEFCGDLRVLVTWDDHEVEVTSLSELLPHSFSPASGVQEYLGKETNG